MPSSDQFDHVMHSTFTTMSDEKLFVKDSRTACEYEIPIHRNAISATEFKKIKGLKKTSLNHADNINGGLRIYDPGLQNTAIVETTTTFAYESLSFTLALESTTR